MTPRTFDLGSFVCDIDCSCEMPWAQRSFPWPGVSWMAYLMGFLEMSFSEGSLTERNWLEAVGTEGGRLIVASVDVWEV